MRHQTIASLSEVLPEMPVPIPKSPNVVEMVKSIEESGVPGKSGKYVGKDSLVSRSRTAENPVQLIQLLHAFEQQDPGWPFLTNMKIQMQKCDKCSQEFCSSLNYRRHVRVHHRLKMLDKDSAKNRELLAAFWDKLSVEEAWNILSFDNVALEEVPGSSLMMALRAVSQKPSLSGLPHVYLRAGSALLDIIQAKSSRLQIPSKELFSIFDDASENTFLRGTAALMRKYIFDGDARKIGLETKNLVASTSFLLEQKLVKAWLADKDAEALRCQKLLVEEEEAAQRRQAKLLEKKRQKKLRQKEQRGKEQSSWEKQDNNETVTHLRETNGMPETHEMRESVGTLASSDSDSQDLETIPSGELLSVESLEVKGSSEGTSDHFGTGRSSLGFNDSSQGYDRRSGQRQVVTRRWHFPLKPQEYMLNHSRSEHFSHESRTGSLPKYGTSGDLRIIPPTSSKVWSRKTRPENDGVKNIDFSRMEEKTDRANESKANQVVIGSISVSLGNPRSYEDHAISNGQQERAKAQVVIRKDMREKPTKVDQIHGGTNRPVIQLWRPVSRNGNKIVKTLEKKTEEKEDSNAKAKFCEGASDSLVLAENLYPGNLQFNIQDAKALLTQRWNEAMAAEHLTLVLSPGGGNDYQEVMADAEDARKRNVLGNAENRLETVSAPSLDAKSKQRRRNEMKKSMKYVPKRSKVK